ncbi:MAG: hypothetical protein GYA23_12880 [Methanomicrobiales archaeon]|nr:hypothetical protein [Methanomicrobiales archaeon]
MLFELLTFFIGIAFGFLHKGKEDYTGILKNGIIAGAVVGIVATLATMFLLPSGSGLRFDFLGAFGIILVIVVYIIILVFGAFLGDIAEKALRK